MEAFLVGPMLLAAAVIKLLISGVKQFVPGLRPNVLRITSILMGIPVGFLLNLELIPGVSTTPLMTIGNHILAGAVVGLMGIGVHEVTPAGKK